MVRRIRKLLQTYRPFKRTITWTISLGLSFILVVSAFLYLFPLIPLRAGPIAQLQAYAYSSRRIFSLALFKRDTEVPGATAEEIVETIVDRRTRNTYLYTGGHYTDFYPRNLGTFANKLLDPLAADSASEWLDRLELMVRSTEIALDVFNEYDQVTTTIVQLDNGKYVPINVYVRPSDSLPSILRVLHQMRSIQELPRTFVLTVAEQTRMVQLQDRAAHAMAAHQDFLRTESEKYVNELTDAEGLIRSDVKLSGIKDAWVRHSAFYDNVMLWGVYHFAYELGLKPEWEDMGRQTRSNIIRRFWNEEEDIFYDEHPAYVKGSYLSADVLVAYDFGMIRPTSPQDWSFLDALHGHIQKTGMDRPFPLKGTELRIPEKEHLPVRLFAPNYWGTTIWSYWGMVYVNMLTDLGAYEQRMNDEFGIAGNEYYDLARQHMRFYEQNIEKYKGFPEVYHPDGEQYRLPVYRSVNDMVWGIYYLYLENKVSNLP